ncbi:MAG: phosphoribosyl-AMP cyclohydrolase [Deltaproteobacteria bacterium]|nr:phosphoribosyl-AMP cyclohydrolase [Deltaproteobacteria bacterium]
MEKIDFAKANGLVPVIVQDYDQEVRDAFIDCDNDTILLQVNQIGGAACHEGFRSCFFRQRSGDDWEICAERVFDPKEVYKKSL